MLARQTYWLTESGLERYNVSRDFMTPFNDLIK